MHGRPRCPDKPEDSSAAEAKAAKLRDLQAQVLHNHHSRTYTKEALRLSFKLLEINSEAYTAWNYRKLVLQHNLREISDPEAVKSAVDDRPCIRLFYAVVLSQEIELAHLCEKTQSTDWSDF